MFFEPVFGLKTNLAFLLTLLVALSATVTLIALFVSTMRGFSDPKSLRRASRAMAWLAGFGAILIPVAVVLDFLFPGGMGGISIVANHLLTDAVPPAHRLVGLAITLVPTAFLAWALLSLRALFFAYSRGEVFSLKAVRSIAAVAASLFGSVVSKLILQVPLSFVLSMHNPPGRREISFGIQPGDIGLLFWAGVFLIIALVMREAQRAADENASIV